MIEIEGCDTAEELDTVLESPPENLIATYERILSRISRPSAIRNLRVLLSWLLYSVQPLRLGDLRKTVAINWQDPPYFEPKKMLNQRPRILEQCTFFISVDDDLDADDILALDDDDTASRNPNDAVLRLAHASVVQFLQATERLSDHSLRFSMSQPAGQLMLARSSLAYLLYSDTTKTSNEVIQNDGLLHYAAKHWYSHIQQIHNSYDQTLAKLIREVLKTKWEVYRLVTYPNPSTIYNPWAAPPGSMTGSIVPDGYPCEKCRNIRYKDLAAVSGCRHRTYNDLRSSAKACRVCAMIHHALLQFGIARTHGLVSLSDKEAQVFLVRVDSEISRNAGDVEVKLTAESHDPFLFIQCYCYFGRLHLFTKEGKSILLSDSTNLVDN